MLKIRYFIRFMANVLHKANKLINVNDLVFWAIKYFIDYFSHLLKVLVNLSFRNPIVFRLAKNLWSFGHSECNQVIH